MTAPAALIADYIHQVEKRDAQIAELRKRVTEAEAAWVEAVNRAREAQEELTWLKKELGEEAE